MTVERVSILFICVAMIFQQLQIMSLRNRIHFGERQRKSILRSISLQNIINEMLVNLIDASLKIK